MKIYPVSSLKLKQQNTEYFKPSAATPINENLQSFPTGYYMPVFGARPMDFASKLAALENIHCPVCGKEMLNEEQFKKLIQLAGSAQNIREFASVLEKAKMYMPQNYDKPIRFIRKIASNSPDLSISDLGKIISKGTETLLHKEFNHSVNHISRFEKENNLSQADIEKLDLCKTKMSEFANKPIPAYKDVKVLLNETISAIDNQKRWDLYTKIKDNLKEIYNYHFIFKTPKDNSLPLGANYLNKMLSPSKSVVYKINKNLDDSKRFNQLLICTDCNNYKFNTIRGWMQWQKDMPQNVKTYLDDISQAVIDNKLDKDSKYVQEVPGLIKQRSNYKINYNKSDLDGKVLSKIFEENRIPYRFERFENIPCAYCNTTTTTHDQKLQLKTEIKNSSTLFELRNIAAINEKHIHPAYQKTIRLFNEILIKNPDISEQEMLSELQKQSKNNIKIEYSRMRSAIIKEVKKTNLNIFDKYLLKDFLNQAENCLAKANPDRYLSTEFYSKIIGKTLDQMQNPIKEKLKFIAIEKMRSILLTDSVLVPPPTAIKENITPLKVVFETIFNRATLTGDHFLAKSMGGANTDENIIGCCRHCNKEKDDLSPDVYSRLHPSIKSNIPKHLSFIKELMEKEHMNNSNSYITKLAKNIKTVSNYKINPGKDI